MKQLMLWRDEKSADWGRQTMPGVWHMPIKEIGTSHKWDQIMITADCAKAFDNEMAYAVYVDGTVRGQLGPNGTVVYL